MGVTLWKQNCISDIRNSETSREKIIKDFWNLQRFLMSPHGQRRNGPLQQVSLDGLSYGPTEIVHLKEGTEGYNFTSTDGTSMDFKNFWDFKYS